MRTIARMLNYIWFGLIAIALVVAAFNGTAENIEVVTARAMRSAATRYWPRILLARLIGAGEVGVTFRGVSEQAGQPND